MRDWVSGDCDTLKWLDVVAAHLLRPSPPESAQHKVPDPALSKAGTAVSAAGISGGVGMKPRAGPDHSWPARSLLLSRWDSEQVCTTIALIRLD